MEEWEGGQGWEVIDGDGKRRAGKGWDEIGRDGREGTRREGKEDKRGRMEDACAVHRKEWDEDVKLEE